MTLREACAAGEAAARPGETFRRVFLRDGEWVAVIATGRKAFALSDGRYLAVDGFDDVDPARLAAIVRHEVVGRLR